jgi:hypothetical protein
MFKYRLMLAAIALIPLRAEAAPVYSAFLLNTDPDVVPELTVVQEPNAFALPRYARILEEHVPIKAWMKGTCGTNWRVQSAELSSLHEDYSGDSPLFAPGSGMADPGPENWSISFAVNQDHRTFGPHVADLEQVPTEWLTHRLTAAGEELIISLAETTGLTPKLLRAQDLETTFDLGLTFWFKCRRYAGNNDWAIKTVRAYFPLQVTYRAHSGGGTLGQPPQPMTFDDLTTGTRIDHVHLLMFPDETPDSCAMVLNGAFRTSAPTVVTYQFVDARGARSALRQVSVDESGFATVMHEVDFTEGTGETIGFTTLDPPSPSGIAFGSSLVDLPSDNLRGYYRIETISPHRSLSNIVSYNLRDCTAEQGPTSFFFNVALWADPDKVREAVREAVSEQDYAPASGN